MGCAASKRIHKEERVQRCKERKRLMKQLLGLRSEFAAAQMAYLHALKNTGATLRQFTEAESLELDIPPSFDPVLSPLPQAPPPLPPLPPPPPPPPFSPDEYTEVSDEEDDSSSTPPPPPLPSSNWDFWDPFGSSSCSSISPIRHNKSEAAGQKVEEENWAETNTEFDEEEEEHEEVEKKEEKFVATDVVPKDLLPDNPPAIELADDNSSMVSWGTKETGEMTLDVGRSKKTLSGIVNEIDEYFLKAFDSGREIAVLLDINRGDPLNQNFGESMRKSCKSAKVFSALSWSRSFKSLHSSKDAVEFHGSDEPCKPGAHSITLDKLYAEEEKLYKELKEEENTKLEYERKTMLLQKQEAGDHDLLKTEEIRSSIESLQSDIICLQQSIRTTCLSILKLRDDELYPQLVELSSRLQHMWRTMYECHQIQNHIALQMNHLTNHPSIEPTTDYHRQSTVQLETEVNAWYSSFCSLLKSQHEYIGVLNRWVQLTDHHVDDQQQSDHLPRVHALCEEWHLVHDRLPDKAASEAIKSFVSVIHSVVLQQAEERILQKKSERLEKRLQKALISLNEMEKKFEGNLTGEMVSSLSPNHPMLVKRARTEAFKKRVEDEKAKYLNSVQLSRAMTLNNLQTCLPNVFRALTGFSSACAQVFEAVHNCTKSNGSS